MELHISYTYLSKCTYTVHVYTYMVYLYGIALHIQAHIFKQDGFFKPVVVHTTTVYVHWLVYICGSCGTLICVREKVRKKCKVYAVCTVYVHLLVYICGSGGTHIYVREKVRKKFKVYAVCTVYVHLLV